MDVVINKAGTVIVSERDALIVEQYSNGMDRSKIAEYHKISIRTVEAATNKLRVEFGCKNLAHLVAEFLRKGLIK